MEKETRHRDFTWIPLLCDGDQASNDQVNIPTIQLSQEEESKAQELA